MDRKLLVLYYSWAGHTKKVAEAISKLTGADLQEIVPITPYSQDYAAVVKSAKKEIAESIHPDIQNLEKTVSEYTIVLVGSPIWCGTIAPPVATCLSEYDFSGKTLLPFITHGGGGKAHTDSDLTALCPNSTLADALAIFGDGGDQLETTLTAWLNAYGLMD